MSQSLGPAFQGLPVVHSEFVDQNNHITGPWYRFMLTTWQKIGAGVSNDVTLGTLQLQANHNETLANQAQTSANGAQGSADTNSAAIEAETQRSIAAENTLQVEITSLANQIDGLSVVGVAGVPTGTPVASLAITHDGTSYLIPLYAP